MIPTLKMLRRIRPDDSLMLVSLGVSEILAASTLFAGRGLFDQALFFSTKGGDGVARRFARWLALAWKLRRLGVRTIIYGLRPLDRDFARRVRWHRFFLKVSGARLVGCEAGDYTSPKQLAVSVFERICGGLGVSPAAQAFDHVLPLASEDRAEADRWWASHPELAGKKFIVACISAARPSRVWSHDRFAEVLRRLHASHGILPVIVGGPGDGESARQVIAKIGAGIDGTGPTVGAFAVMFRSALFYLGNDTGLMHLAAASGLRCVVVMSAANRPKVWDPLGEGHLILKREVACRGCGVAVCVKYGNACLEQIRPDEVYEACLRMLDSGAASPARSW